MNSYQVLISLIILSDSILRQNQPHAFQSPPSIYSAMKIDFQTFTDVSDYTRYKFYETWFNVKSVNVMEKKMMDDDWQVMTSVSLPKQLLEILKLKTLGPRISTSFANFPTSTNSYRARTLVDCLEFSTQVKKKDFQVFLLKNTTAGESDGVLQ